MNSRFIYVHDQPCLFCGRIGDKCICGSEDVDSFDVCGCGCGCRVLVIEGGKCSACLYGKCKSDE